MLLTTENLFEIFSVIGNCTILVSTILKARGYTKKFENYCTKEEVDVIVDKKMDMINKILEVKFQSMERQLNGVEGKIDEFKELVLGNKLKITD